MASTKLHVVNPPAGESKIIQDEPVWDGGNVNESNYTMQLMRGFNWHTYCGDKKNYVKYIEEWIRATRPKTAKTDLAGWKRVPDRDISSTHPIMARMMLQGFPLKKEHESQIWPWVSQLIKDNKSSVRIPKDVVAPPRKSVQDHMQEQVSPILSDFDYLVDLALGEEEYAKELETCMTKCLSLKAPQLLIVQKYLTRYIEEWDEALGAMQGKALRKDSSQLAEGYSYIAKRPFKKVIDSFKEILTNLSKQVTVTKVQRVRRQKPTDKKKLVAKLRFMEKDVDLKIQSLPAIDVLGASAVWVFDTQKRKLGYYEAEFSGSIHAKGTTILGVKPSFQKILRKPEEQLVEFRKLRKNQTAAWFDKIRAKAQPLTGRTNQNLILLRVD